MAPPYRERGDGVASPSNRRNLLPGCSNRIYAPDAAGKIRIQLRIGAIVAEAQKALDRSALRPPDRQRYDDPARKSGFAAAHADAPSRTDDACESTSYGETYEAFRSMMRDRADLFDGPNRTKLGLAGGGKAADRKPAGHQLADAPRHPPQ
jgi:hypothetical protein